MKKALVIFTKVPKVGEVKTRLTKKRGGILTDEEAYAFYKSCLLDVLDVSLSTKQADVWICYNKDGNRTELDLLLTQVNYPQQIAGVFSDQGGSIDECRQYVTEFILRNGKKDRLADALLIVSGDLPTLQPYILLDSLEKIEKLSMSEDVLKVAQIEDQKNDLTNMVSILRDLELTAKNDSSVVVPKRTIEFFRNVMDTRFVALPSAGLAI